MQKYCKVAGLESIYIFLKYAYIGTGFEGLHLYM